MQTSRDTLRCPTRTVYDDLTPTTPTSAPSATSVDAFACDTIGNRTRSYLRSATNTDCLHNPVNEYAKETTGGDVTHYGHDAAGNLTRAAAAEGVDSDGDRRYHYDYENQMTKAEERVDGQWVTKGEYARDALMRRIEYSAGGPVLLLVSRCRRRIESGFPWIAGADSGGFA